MTLNHKTYEKFTEEPAHEAIFDAIEYCRGQLSAMAYVSPSTAREVNSKRLRIAFERAGIAHKLRFALWVLDFMREVQKLGDGYWFPTPLRIVPIEGQAIIVGVAGTSELQRHFPSVKRAGYARVLFGTDIHGLPTQQLDNWLGLRVLDSVAWCEAYFADARDKLAPTISPGNIQFFNVRTTRSTYGDIAVPEWVDVPQPSMQLKGIFLCRERLGRDSFRYFLGKVEGKSLLAESPIPYEGMARLCCGFAARMGKPITVTVISCNEDFIIYTPGNLPRSERQLILALGVRDRGLKGMAYRVCDDKFVSLIAAKLKNLGCEMRRING
jgi:hypothetical protein